jgi:predicted ribosomally synthesized peptide with nif11-like leader
MINTEIERFAVDVGNDVSLRDEIKAIGSTDLRPIVELANSKGYKFSADDVKSQLAEGEVSDIHLGNTVAFVEVLLAGTSTNYAFATPHKALVWYE